MKSLFLLFRGQSQNWLELRAKILEEQLGDKLANRKWHQILKALFFEFFKRQCGLGRFQSKAKI